MRIEYYTFSMTHYSKYSYRHLLLIGLVLDNLTAITKLKEN